MISASKCQHIIYFMSQLKVSLCISRPKQRLLCMDTRRGCRSKRSPTPWKSKNIFFRCMGGLFVTFFSMGRALCYVFFTYKGFVIVWRLFCYFFLRGGLFVTSSSWCGTFFTMWGPFLLFFSPCGGTSLSSWGILCIYVFLWGCPVSL